MFFFTRLLSAIREARRLYYLRLEEENFCKIALYWGWGIEETAARLMQESDKAQRNGEAYALRTARNAAAAIERRGGWQR
jgi:hypothetical protein